jgi:hypothetical protein
MMSRSAVGSGGGLVQIHHRGVLVVTHARRHDPMKQTAGDVAPSAKNDRTREHGALANPGGRPRRTNAGRNASCRSRWG